MAPTRIAFRYGRRTLFRIFRFLLLSYTKLKNAVSHPRHGFTVSLFGLVIINKYIAAFKSIGKKPCSESYMGKSSGYECRLMKCQREYELVKGVCNFRKTFFEISCFFN